jgi:hypothetical protein
VRFQPDLATLVPDDIMAFQSHADAMWPVSVLFVMALLWSPLAVRLFAEEISQHTSNLEPGHLCMALHATVRGIDRLAQEGGHEWHQHLAHDAILFEQGLQHSLGAGSTARLFQVAEPAPPTHKALCRVSSGGPGLKLTQNHERCQKLIQALCYKLESKPTKWEECEDVIEHAKTLLVGLPMWAGNNTRTRSHVLLRLALLWAPSADQNNAISSQMMELVSAENLRAHIPVHWDICEVAALVAETNPLMLNTWMSSLENAFQNTRAKEWFDGGEASSHALLSAADELREQNHGVNPTLCKVIAHAAEAWIRTSKARKAGTDHTKVTECKDTKPKDTKGKVRKKKASKTKTCKA